MKMLFNYFRNLLLFVLLISFFNAKSQKNEKCRVLTLDQVIKIAVEQSPQAEIARHNFRASFWSFKSYKSNYLPSLLLESNPIDLNRDYVTHVDDDGKLIVVKRQSNSSIGSLKISQRVPFTGGNLTINSSLNSVSQYGDSTINQFIATPLSIGYNQPLFTFNSYKWERKIEPLLYKEAERKYVSQLEEISKTAVSYFFELILAQINKEISQKNYYNNDTLYKISKGRYNMGTIAKDELLQMEMAFLTSRKDFNESDLNLQVARFKLNSFMGFTDNKPIKLVLPKQIDTIKIKLDSALYYAHKNNPEMISMIRQSIEANRDVAKARAENLFNANLHASVGINNSALQFNSIADHFDNSQVLTVGVSIPIIDWGVGRGKYEMAKSKRELSLITIEQQKVDFDQQLYLQVMRFNMQSDQILISSKSDTIAQIRYNITKQRFKTGNVSILDLNVASKEKDVAKRNYVSVLSSYYQNYFSIRKNTLYDFVRKKELGADFKSIIKEIN